MTLSPTRLRRGKRSLPSHDGPPPISNSARKRVKKHRSNVCRDAAVVYLQKCDALTGKAPYGTMRCVLEEFEHVGGMWLDESKVNNAVRRLRIERRRSAELTEQGENPHPVPDISVELFSSSGVSDLTAEAMDVDDQNFGGAQQASTEQNDAASTAEEIHNLENSETSKTFIGASPNASITSKMLADMLAAIDRSGVFPRTCFGGSSVPITPVLVLDGHHSRLEIPFLDYIMDERHRWFVCMGVPYATHIWQMADSPEMNGLFKQACRKVKMEIYRTRHHLKMYFVPEDVIPIVTYAFQESYAKTDLARKAIAARGWYPANYVLLDDHPQVVRSGADDDSSDDESVQGGVPSTARISLTSDDLNLSSGSAAVFFEKLVREGMFDEERKKRLSQQRAEEDQQESLETGLRKMGRITSGNLAAVSQFEISNADLHRVVAEKAVQAERQRLQRQENAVARTSSQRARYKEARQLVIDGKTIRTSHLKSIAIAMKRTGDSAVKEKRGELIEQVGRRIARDATTDSTLFEKWNSLRLQSSNDSNNTC